MANARIWPRQRPIIRVFVSSTFSDLKPERDALQQRVYPRLEQRCLKDGFQFQAIDLRWGVPTEAGLDHRTMRICFEELRRSQEVSPEPNFLILLGNRYGWRPLPEGISADELRSLEEAAGQIGGAGQQTPLEVLRRWYRLDENTLTPVYVLQPRRGPKGGDSGEKDYATAEAWREVEQALWQIINRAFPACALEGRFDSPPPATEPLPPIVRFQASATEQEIWCGALSVLDARQHVLAFFRELDPPRDMAAAQSRDYFDITSGEIDPVAQAALRDLKDEIKKRLGGNAVELPAARMIPAEDGRPASVSTDHMDGLCREVEARLTAIIDRQIEQYWRDPQCSDDAGGEPVAGRRSAREREIERDAHLRFGSERGAKDSFVGRTDQLRRILAYVGDDSRLPLVVHGDSGCGKTALLARAFQEIDARKKPILRFIGVTPRSSEIRSLLRDLCEDLRQRNPIEGPLPADVRELMQEWRQHLEGATAERPVILFLDALDQLSEADNARGLLWIPLGLLPDHVKVVVSCLSGRDENDPANRPYVSLQRRGLPAENMLNLDALSVEDARSLLFDRWLPAAGRRVNDAQRRLIEGRLEAAGCRQPLYLKLLFEEAKLWRSYDEPPEPGGSAGELLDQLCQRLSRPEIHGESLVRFVLGYLAAARRGLSETELLGVLFADHDYKRGLDEASRRNRHTLPTQPPRIPIAIWARLHSDLAPYLAERSAPGGDVLTFYHREVAEWVQEHVAKGPGQERNTLRRRLAEYFSRADVSSKRQFDELPWLWQQAEAWNELHVVMTNPFLVGQFYDADEPTEMLNYCSSLQRHYDLRGSFSEDTVRRWAAALPLALGPRRAVRVIASVGDLLGKLRAYSTAESWCKAALQLSETLLEPGDPLILQSIHNYASVLASGGASSEPEPMFRRLIDQQDRTLGPDHTNTLKTINNLAVLLAQRGDYDEAEALYRRVMQRSEARWGFAHLNTLRSAHSLVSLLVRRKDQQAAVSLARRVTEAAERALGPDHSFTLASMDNLATCFFRGGETDESLRTARKVLEASRRVLGINNPETLDRLGSLGALLLSLKRYEEAAPIILEALLERRRILGLENGSAVRMLRAVLRNLNQEMARLSQAGDYQGSLRRAQQLLEITERIFGADSLQTAHMLKNVGSLHYLLGEYDEAETYLPRAITGFRQTLSADNRHASECEQLLEAIRSRRKRPATGVSPERGLQDALEAFRSFIRTGQLELAEKGLRRLLARHVGDAPAAGPVRELLASCLAMRALSLAADPHAAEEALRLFREALALDPHDAVLHANIAATIWTRFSRVTEAEALFVRAIELAPGNEDIQRAYAEFIEKTGRLR